MTEIDFVEIQLMAILGIDAVAINFLTVVFAYVVAAYVAGQKLSRITAILLSTVYTLWLVGPLLGMVTFLDTAVINVTEYQILFPSGGRLPRGLGSTVGYVLTLGPLITGWIGSLLFMHVYIRNKTRGNSNGGT
jgi:hypothetical protein